MFKIKREEIINSIAPLVRNSPEGMFRWKTNILKNPWLFEAQDLVEANTLMVVMLDDRAGTTEVMSIDFVKDFEELQELIADCIPSECEVHVLVYDEWNDIFKEVPIRLGVTVKRLLPDCEEDSEEDIEDTDFFDDVCFLNEYTENIDSFFENSNFKTVYFDNTKLSNISSQNIEDKIGPCVSCDIKPFIEIIDGYMVEYTTSTIFDFENSSFEDYGFESCFANCESEDLSDEKYFMAFATLENAFDYALGFVKELDEDSTNPTVTISNNWHDFVFESNGDITCKKCEWCS